jgi:hypothetical protein
MPGESGYLISPLDLAPTPRPAAAHGLRVPGAALGTP